ncbi:MAG: penicillin-binding transpeptidase domain-containing protein, partial [Planctomycetota bacterium]|nr:penicillin-binding transpeptidase domain-containing protein [Planctomycetota bacterium]
MTPPFNHSRNKATEASTTAVAESPDGRLRVFVALISLPLLAVFLRIAELGVNRNGLLQASNGAVRSVLEPIPARDGRIISSDGRILAEDVETFSLLLHYRWFERPADPAWLRGEALRSLTQPERRDLAMVLAAEEIALARREALWASLVEISGLSIEELQRRFTDRQREIVELRRTVEDRRAASLFSSAAQETAPPATTWWEAAGRHVWRAVTTSPRPIVEEPLVLAEELDYHEIATGLPLAVAADVESLPERFPGTRVRVSSRRRYPLGATASHVIGYRFHNADAIGASESPTTSVGQSGVERSYDRHLRGIAGLRRVWLDRRGETIRTAIERQPRVGRDLVLNVDAGLQTEIEHLLDEAIAGVRKAAEAPVPDTAGGCVVVLDLRSGAILASTSAPRFDLALAADRDPELWKKVLSDKAMPLFDRVTSAALPPGSVFKTVTAAALLDSRRIDPDEPFD